MKEAFSRYVITQILVFAAALLLLFFAAFSDGESQIDVVAVNDCVQTAKEHWSDRSFGETKLSRERLMILSADGSVLYQTDEKTFDGISSQTDAIRKGMFCIPVTDADTFLGTVVMPDPAKEDKERLMRRIFLIICAVMAVIVLSCVSFFLYVERNVIRPFGRMKGFAEKIAQGDLDEPLLLEKNNMFGLFTESFDTMREELRASKNREIALKVREKELVASLSHDLRSPVTGIKVICELLEVKVEDAYVRGKIENIRQKTDEMDALLTDLLSAALDDLGELNVNCSEVASDVLTELVDEHDPKRKTVTGEVPGCILRIDRNRLSQVIGNIIGNSYKYADTEIEVTYGFRDRYLEMTIRDRGEGADPEELPLLTNKFYRGKKSAADKEGSGLGLYISSELMKKMKGQLILSSEDGFAVTLLLPLA